MTLRKRRARCWRRLSSVSRVRALGTSPLARPPRRARISRRNLGRPQRDEMASLVGIAPDFGALAAAHVAFEFMDRRRLRSPNNVEGNSLIRVAAKAFHFEITKPGLQCLTQRGRWLRRTL